LAEHAALELSVVVTEKAKHDGANDRTDNQRRTGQTGTGQGTYTYATSTAPYTDDLATYTLAIRSLGLDKIG